MYKIKGEKFAWKTERSKVYIRTSAAIALQLDSNNV